MISVVIPTLNAAATLPRTLQGLTTAAAEGLVQEVIIADGGSDDATLAIADDTGCRVTRCERGRGAQLAAGAKASSGRWLLFLHADTLLEPKWRDVARRFIRAQADGA
ncbi:MAG: glycosyltransferase, partial [Caulobacterales bacterium]|nr:glycosyltransferase [Caulobacterales bacterium]